MKLLALGALLVLVPYFLAHSAVGRALQVLMLPGFGLVLFAAFLLARQGTAAHAVATNIIERKPARVASKLPAAARVVPAQPATDRVADARGRDLRPRKAVRETRSQVVGTTHERLTGELFAQIEWRRFEAVIETLFSQAGFETRSQSHGADGGVDIWLHPRSAPATPVSIVQCKHWVGKRVGVDKVRELKGVMASHSLRRGHFATTSSFTPEAARFASDNGIHLLDIDAILRLIGMRPQADQRALLAVATEGEYWRPTCASCGEKLVERKPRSGASPFWGCANYPRCRTTMPMRADRVRDAQPA